MKEETILKLDILYSKISYIVACLSSYPSLDLSKRILDINEKIYLIRQSIIDEKEYIDIRDVINLREKLNEINKRLDTICEVHLDGHKISCLLFEVSSQLKLIIIENSDISEDMKEYLKITSDYLYSCARIINIEILNHDNKIIK